MYLLTQLLTYLLACLLTYYRRVTEQLSLATVCTCLLTYSLTYLLTYHRRVTEQLSLVTSELSARKDATAEEYLCQRRAVAQVAARMLSQEVDSRARPATAARSRQVHVGA